jgi:hypothetical protein
MVETQTVTIEDGDGETDSVEIPDVLVELMRDGDKSGAGVVADIVLQAFAQQGHARVHHAEGGVSEEMEEANEKLEDLFEERFGISLADAMGHHH